MHRQVAVRTTPGSNYGSTHQSRPKSRGRRHDLRDWLALTVYRYRLGVVIRCARFDTPRSWERCVPRPRSEPVAPWSLPAI